MSTILGCLGGALRLEMLRVASVTSAGIGSIIDKHLALLPETRGR